MKIQIKKVDDPALMQMISELSVKTFYETYALFNTVKNMQDYTSTYFSPARLLEEFNTPNNFLFLVYVNDEVAGYFKIQKNYTETVGKDLRQLELQRLYILKEFQQQKLGFYSMKYCIEEAAVNGFEVLWLGVWEKNEKALRFYKKMGFETFGEHTFALGDDSQKDFLMKLYIKNYKLPLLNNQQNEKK
ncbi:MAG: GNAT family N-acetyltransferase [Chitinophagaceae bacterium]